MNKENTISEKLAECISLLRQWQNEYAYYTDRVGDCDKTKTDLIHYIELDDCNYAERCKLATQLRNCLLERRENKNKLEEREPIAAFLSAPQNKGFLDSLGRVLGDTRKVEKYHNNRYYHPRSKMREADEKR